MCYLDDQRLNLRVNHSITFEPVCLCETISVGTWNFELTAKKSKNRKKEDKNIDRNGDKVRQVYFPYIPSTFPGQK
jgi:hypothetical protein